MRHAWLLALLFACSTTKADPKKPSRQAQCASFVEMIDGEKETLSQLGGEDANTLVKIANRIEQAGVTASNIPLFDDELIELRRRWVVMARDVGGAARDMGEAFASKNEERITRVSDRLNTSRAVEANLRAAIDRACPRQ